ncbi:MAG: hypothetical protein IJW87_03310 [Clostridia bacterium]|nr:hypothetical protein [Clostridia bacterium]
MNRKVNFKKKFIATVSMLLVSAILLTGTTFAWLVMSTAPSIEGVTTQISANGFLEIALASPETMAALLASDMYETGITSAFSTGDLFTNNRRWGNVIDLGDTRYGLDSLVLKPSVLNIVNGTVQANPILTASYGNDGRIDLLDSFSALGGFDIESLSYLVSKGLDYGVRFAGVPHNSEVLDNVEKSAQKTRAAAKLLIGKYSDLMHKSLAALAEGYTTADMREFLTAVEALNEQFKETIGYIDALYENESPDAEETAIKAKLRAAYEESESNLKTAWENLESYEAEDDPDSTTATGDTATDKRPINLTDSQVDNIVWPIMGVAVDLYEWNVVGSHVEGDKVVYDYGWVKPENGIPTQEKQKIILGKTGNGCFHPIAVVCGFYSTTVGNITWATETDEISIVAQLSGDNVYEDYKHYLKEFESLEAQREGMMANLLAIVTEEHEDEAEFFYEYTIGTNVYSDAGPHYVRLKERVAALEIYTEYLENYLKAAVMAYVSGGSVDRSVYLRVRAVEADATATARDYVEAAGLSEGTSFGKILSVCETVFEKIYAFEAAAEALDYDLAGGEYDADGNPTGTYSGWVRYIEKDELLSVWDIVSGMLSAGITMNDRTTGKKVTYTTANFAENARRVFARNVESFELYPDSVYYQLAALQGELGLYYPVTVDASEDYVGADIAYLDGYVVFIGAGNEGDENETIILDSIVAIEKNYDKIQTATKFDVSFAAYAQAARTAWQTFDANRVHAALDSYLASVKVPALLVGSMAGLSGEEGAKTIALAEPIVEDLENAVKAQVYLWAAGKSAQAYADFEAAEQRMAEEAAKKGQSYTPASADDQTYLIDTLLALGTDATLEKLVEVSGIEGDADFMKVYNAYVDVETSMTAQPYEDENGNHVNPSNVAKFAMPHYEGLTLTAGENAFYGLYSVLHDYADETLSGGTVSTYETFFEYDGIPGRGNVIKDVDGDGETELTFENDYQVDTKYLLETWTKFGLYEAEDVVTSSETITLNYAVSEIKSLIDNITKAQTVTQSDREAIYQSAVGEMQSTANLAQKYYDLYLGDEEALLQLILAVALEKSDIEAPETETTPDDEPAQTEETGTYSRVQVEAVRRAMKNLDGAYAALDDFVYQALLVIAVSDETTEEVFKQAIKADTKEELLSLLSSPADGLGSRTTFYTEFIEKLSAHAEIKTVANGLDALLNNDKAWTNTFLLRDSYNGTLLGYLDTIADFDSMTISGYTFAEFKAITDALDVQVKEEIVEGSSTMIDKWPNQEIVLKKGVSFEIHEGGLLFDVYHVFELAHSSKKTVASAEAVTIGRDREVSQATKNVIPTISTDYDKPVAYFATARAGIRMTVVNEMYAWLELAKNTYHKANANERTLWLALATYLRQDIGITPEVVSYYTLEDIQYLNSIVEEYSDAMDSLDLAVRYALFAIAANESPLLYDEVTKLISEHDIMEMMGIGENHFLWQFDTMIDDIRQDLHTVYSSFWHLMTYDSTVYHEGDDKYYYDTADIHEHFTEIARALAGYDEETGEYEDILVNGEDAKAFAAKMDDLHKQPIPGNNRVPTLAQTLIKDGVTVEVKAGAFVDMAHIFAKRESSVSKYGTTIIGNGNAEVRDIEHSFGISYGKPEGKLTQAENFMKTIPNAGLPAAGLNTDSYHLLSDVYAFALDFLFRTNATGANLLLQTDPVQRIYSESDLVDSRGVYRFEESVIEEMLGGGSFIEFSIEDPTKLEALATMESAIATEEEKADAWMQLGGAVLDAMCVVFADTVTGQVYATARPCLTYYSVEDQKIGASLCIVDEDGEVLEEQVIKPLVTQQVSTVTAWVYLDGTMVDNTVMAAEMDTDISINLQFATDANLKPSVQQIPAVNPEETE